MAELRLDGKVALVTGASRGIGAAIAKTFAENGAQVMLSSRKIDGLEQAAAGIRTETAVHAAHVGDPDAARRCVDATLDRFGSLDILVNNAATNPYFGPAIEINPSQFDKTVEVNQRAPLLWAQAAWQSSMAARGGVILNIASIGAMTFGGPIGVYDGTKAALVHLTRHLATELGPGVRVNGIAPGLVKTEMARALWERDGESLAAGWPLRRLGEPEDIAQAALFLASDFASWITGDVLVVDGGAVLTGFSI